jgi:hypothetical protein
MSCTATDPPPRYALVIAAPSWLLRLAASPLGHPAWRWLQGSHPLHACPCNLPSLPPRCDRLACPGLRRRWRMPRRLWSSSQTGPRGTPAWAPRTLVRDSGTTPSRPTPRVSWRVLAAGNGKDVAPGSLGTCGKARPAELAPSCCWRLQAHVAAAGGRRQQGCCS